MLAPEASFALVSLAVVAVLVGGPLWRRWQRRRLGERPFPARWRQVLRRRFPLYNRLPPPLQRRLQRMVQVFVAVKPVIGCQGLRVTDDMRVLIAAQACVLVLERHATGLAASTHAAETVAPYPNLREVLLYPDAFVVPATHHEPGGVVTEGDDWRSGESWPTGRVVLSWADTQSGARSGQWVARGPHTAADSHAPAHNLVMHEFAHQLDQETGQANGSPWLPAAADGQAWTRVLGQAYRELRARARSGEPTLLDPYGATAPEEFFAVATEVFFMHPRALAQQHPELYDQLQMAYRLDPRAW